MIYPRIILIWKHKITKDIVKFKIILPNMTIMMKNMMKIKIIMIRTLTTGRKEKINKIKNQPKREIMIDLNIEKKIYLNIR